MTVAPAAGSRIRRSTWLLIAAITAFLIYGGVTVALLPNRSSGPSTASASAVVYAAGDLAGANGGAAIVTEMLSRHNFDALLTLGNHTSDTGSAEEFRDLYAPTYGQFDDRVRPTPGNQDYVTPKAAAYFDYFDRHSTTFSGAPYYAFSLGGWRIYSLNSEIGEALPGGGMYEWLRADLDKRPSVCVLAYWHKPMFTVGGAKDDEGGMALIWSMLAAHGADVVLAGHDRNYQRWKPIDGITSFVVGTGGLGRYPITRADERLASADDAHYGALELELSQTGANFEFRTEQDQVLDSGTIPCSGPVAATSPPEAPQAVLAEREPDGSQRLTWNAPADATRVVGYEVLRGADVIGYAADTTFKDTTLQAGASVLYAVRAINSSGQRSDSSAPAHSAGGAVGFSDSVWSALDTNPSSPTKDKPQSKLWFTHGTWWGILYSDGVADGVPSGNYIHRFDAATQTMQNTRVAVDERDRSHADVLWDEVRQRLYVVSTLESGALKLYRFDYADGAYTTDPGFPIRLSDNGSESATIALDSTGVLWVTITQAADGSGRCVATQRCIVRVMHSTDADYRWTPLVDLPVDGNVVKAVDISAVVAFGGNQIGIAWSNQLDGSFRFASHADGAPDSEWTAAIIVIGPGAADDHINLKADDAGRVYLVAKSSINGPVRTPPETPLITLFVRETGGLWRSAPVWTVRDNLTRPQVVVDRVHGQLAVVASTDSGGVIYVKTAAIDSLAFAPGRGEQLIVGISTNNPTTTKQLVDLAAGALVLAGDTGTHTYWHNLITLSP